MRRLLSLAGAALLAASPACPSPLEGRQTIDFQSTGNPILADGSYYSADPAPIVVNGTVYILSGRDVAGATENNFGINEWQIFESSDPNPSGGPWTLHAGVARPQAVFAWARPGTAYAAQIVRGADGRFYLYAPVTQASAGGGADPFGIGVAVSSGGVLGPYADAHPSGPIISQTVPAPGNSIQNIDPTVLVDDDGRVYIYFGTFGQLLAYELDGGDMATVRNAAAGATRVGSLTGFFEAPWLMKRRGTYYMLYAANNAGAGSPCTPTSYHACIAYGTAPAPLGPWTHRGVVLDIVSSTTSHPGVFTRDGGATYYLTYHTRDAAGGTHFRRSVALDRLEFDDTASPPAIKKVVQTRRAAEGGSSPPPTRNIAPRAKVASLAATPVQYWVEAVHDGRVEPNPLPPDYWCSYAAERSPPSSTLTYTWDAAVRLNGVAMAFFADQPAGSNIGVPPPAAWRVEYLDAAAGAWVAVSLTGAGGYPTTVSNSPAEVGFQTVSTTSIRAVLTASGRNGQYGGVGVKECLPCQVCIGTGLSQAAH
ncbi:putative glycosyl hydrolase family 43 protein [Rosellinia necatrix]|uniref:Putative glycosyl hydrolase family 43 protein n=1 Tax=Rosellinia necatrix TaxID=77044 RepID=A0A1W2TIR0_ROSNE|nr:putative glycosyl hydrolase family 43 protein [Rosellinia necatrix]